MSGLCVRTAQGTTATTSTVTSRGPARATSTVTSATTNPSPSGRDRAHQVKSSEEARKTTRRPAVTTSTMSTAGPLLPEPEPRHWQALSWVTMPYMVSSAIGSPDPAAMSESRRISLLAGYIPYTTQAPEPRRPYSTPGAWPMGCSVRNPPRPLRPTVVLLPIPEGSPASVGGASVGGSGAAETAATATEECGEQEGSGESSEEAPRTGSGMEELD